jgi:hypothetical protein
MKYFIKYWLNNGKNKRPVENRTFNVFWKLSIIYISVQNYSLKYIQKYEIIIFSMKMLTGVKARTTKKN